MDSASLGFSTMGADLETVRMMDGARPTTGKRLGSMYQSHSMGSEASTEEAATFFERMLMETLVKAMRKSVQTSGLFGTNLGAEHWEEYLDSLYVEMAVEQGGGGSFRKALIRQLDGPQSQNQEVDKDIISEQDDSKLTDHLAGSLNRKRDAAYAAALPR